MDNPLKGEVSFEVEGEPYTLVLNINTLCILEERLDISIGQLIEKLTNNVRLGFIRSVLWIGLSTYHPDLTEDDVGDLLASLKLTGAKDLIVQAVARAFPTSEEANAAGDPPVAASPVRTPRRNRRAGTSPPSSASGAG